MTPELSVAIIFRNEIRCIERCLKSVEPVKKTIGCEIVMADTGSDDGSREIAERYADIVLDFPWINDFAAARNAVLDRCSGKWALVMDCDEWLDEDIAELTAFLRSGAAAVCSSAQVAVRNYTSESFMQYGDILTRRMLRMAAGPHYEGAIHESPCFPSKDIMTVLPHTLLHHDGYVMLNNGSEAGKAKRARNLALLELELKKDPDDPIRLKQYIDAADEEDGVLPVLRHALELAEAASTTLWKLVAPTVFCSAAFLGHSRDLPETDEWIQKALDLYPDSYFTRIDIGYLRAMRARKKEDYAAAAALGEAVMAAYAEADQDEDGMNNTIRVGILQRYSPFHRQFLRTRMIESYQRLGRFEEILPLLEQSDWSALDADGIHDMLWLFMELYMSSDLDLTAPMLAFWGGICEEKPDRAAAELRKTAFLQTASIVSSARPDNDRGREPWQLFLPLRGKCALGDMAALMAAGSVAEADALLASCGDLSALTGRALAHALDLGAVFPIPGRPLTLELADTLADRLTAERELLRTFAVASASGARSDQDILWARGLVLAALQNNDWETDVHPRELIEAFVRVESAFLPRCYSENALREQPEYLPPMHRFALHLANVFAVTAPQAVAPEFRPSVTGGIRAALSELKEAVKAAPEQKRVVDLILDDISRTI